MIMLFKATSMYHSGAALPLSRPSPPRTPLILEHFRLGIVHKKKQFSRSTKWVTPIYVQGTIPGALIGAKYNSEGRIMYIDTVY